MNVLLKLSPTTLLKDIVPEEAQVCILSHELMRGIEDEIWSTNQKLMRKRPGVGPHSKEGVQREENTANLPLPIDVAFLLLRMLPSSIFTTTYTIFLMNVIYENPFVNLRPPWLLRGLV